MAHCGYEATAAAATIRNPLAAVWLAIRGVRTEGPMAPEIAPRPRSAAPVSTPAVEGKTLETSPRKI